MWVFKCILIGSYNSILLPYIMQTTDIDRVTLIYFDENLTVNI